MPQRFPSQRLIAENRCAAFFVSPVAPDSETRIAVAGAAVDAPNYALRRRVSPWRGDLRSPL